MIAGFVKATTVHDMEVWFKGDDIVAMGRRVNEGEPPVTVVTLSTIGDMGAAEEYRVHETPEAILAQIREAHPGTGGTQAIFDERMRQKYLKDYSDEHDDEHGAEYMHRAAGCLLVGRQSGPVWAMQLSEKHQKDMRKQLVIAGALCAAAIDVIDREEAKR